MLLSSSLSTLELRRSTLADNYCQPSVTIVSIIRLAYLVKEYRYDYLLWVEYADIFIWTGVEANVSIICGQSTTAFPVLSHGRDNVI